MPTKNQKKSKISLILSILTLAVMLILLVLLSIIQSQRSLVSESPKSIEGWIFVQDEQGNEVKQDFALEDIDTISVANIIDAGERVKTDKSAKKLGEFRVTLASGRKNTFEINTHGVKRLDSFGWQTQLDPNELLEIIQKSVERHRLWEESRVDQAI